MSLGVRAIISILALSLLMILALIIDNIPTSFLLGEIGVLSTIYIIRGEI